MSIIENYLLFNHTYLKQLQRDGSYDEAASAAAQGVREWYEFRETDSIKALVESWVKPMLEILELDLQPLDDDDPHTYLVYSTYDRNQPVALCYVTPPGADLNTTTKGRHWMAQAVITARKWQADKEENSPLRWIILTNGEQWRLLDAQALRRYEAYLQVNLHELAQEGAELSAIRIFYHCFHRQAFVASEDGKTGLERMLEASSHATEKAERHLKKRVSDNEGIMGQLCMGLVQATGQSHFTEEERDAIYRDATYLLYQMLFVFYAEARDLLPTTNNAYQQVALGRLVDQGQRYLDEGIPDPQATTLWDGLQRLRHAINQGEEELGVPGYNGGLFNDEDKPYLSNFQVADAYLARSLVDLAYLSNGHAERERIDYRDLSVRHLGSLYEGMIDYKLFIAEEPMLARRDKQGNVRFLSQKEEGGLRKNDQAIEVGQVYFAQSSGERKATGTYYTPEYVVQYIVENAVWNSLAQRRKVELSEKLSTWLEELTGARPDEKDLLQLVIDKELVDFIEEFVLTFRVCDPAMGSGHFLVNAAHQITCFVVETLHLTKWRNDLVDSDPILWRRRLAESCLYGVDINHMTVELAKLGLWFATLAEDKPLGFLDHHIRQGNSLLGVGLEDVIDKVLDRKPGRVSRKEQMARQAGQLLLIEDLSSQAHLAKATELMQRISSTVTESMDDVQAQRRDYEDVRQELAQYRALANAVLARFFGLDIDDRTLSELGKVLLGDSVATVPALTERIKQAEIISRIHSFFHWEFEFPEVFMKSQPGVQGSSTGFDAVVGNPPYVSHEELRRSSPLFDAALQQQFNRVLVGHWDIFIPFVSKALSLTSSEGSNSFILPNTFGMEKYGRILRETMVENRWLVALVDFGDHQVFEGVSRQYLIYLASPQLGPKEIDIVEFIGKDFLVRRKVDQLGFLEMPNCTFRLAVTSSELNLKRRVDSICGVLGDFCHVNPGISAHSRKESPIKFRKDDVVLKEKPNSEAKRYVEGHMLSRWAVNWDETYIDYSKYQNVFHRPKFPELFESPKIMVRAISGPNNSLICTYDCEKYYTNHSIIHITKWNDEVEKLRPPSGEKIAPHYDQYALGYIVSIINSSLVYFYFSSFIATGTLQGSYSAINPEDLRKLPIFPIDFNSPNCKGTDAAPKMLAGAGIPKFVSSDVLHGLINEKNYTAVDLHNILEKLGTAIVEEHKRLLEAEKKLDIFGYVNREIECVPFEEAFPDLLGSSNLMRELQAFYHDIEDLRLSVSDGGNWSISILLKMRDPASSWKEFKRDFEENFVRDWISIPIARISYEEGLYYKYIFDNLGDFGQCGSIPGGYTRSTFEKLLKISIPVYKPVDLSSLVEAETEISSIKKNILETERVIDQLVYRLYGLTEEEIAIVEGR